MVWACDAPITAVTLRDDDRRLWRVSGPIAIDIEQLPFGEVPSVAFEIDGLEVDRVHADFTEERTLAGFIRWSAQICGT